MAFPFNKMESKRGVSYAEKISLLTAAIDLDLSHYRRRGVNPRVDFAVERMRSRYKKRILPAIANPELERNAVKKFMESNEAMKSFNQDFTLQFDDEVLQEAKSFIHFMLLKGTQNLRASGRVATFDPCDVLDLPILLGGFRLGPRACNGSDALAHVEKTSEVLKGTRSVIRFRRLVGARLPLLRSALYYAVSDEEKHIVSGSSLSCVPKNEDTVRTIASEPAFNQGLQLAAGSYLTSCLMAVGLDIHDQQEKNRLLAYLASIVGDSNLSEGLCTMDLASCSDRIAIMLVKALFPDSWFWLLMSIRSPVANVPGVGVVKLEMISTMGNGFTFPLMTMIILSLVYATGRVMLGWKRNTFDKGCVGVFGDDIICPSTLAAPLASVLARCGLVVNFDKSYTDGYFYESCGGDYYCGYDVTPVYLQSFRNDPELFICINQLISWSTKHDVSLLGSISLLYGFLSPYGKTCLVPEWQSDDAGIRTSDCPRVYNSYKVVPNMLVADLAPADSELRQMDVDRMLFLHGRGDSDILTLNAIGGYIYSEKYNLIATRVHNGRLVIDHKILPRKRADREALRRSLICYVTANRGNIRETSYTRQKDIGLPQGYTNGRHRDSIPDAGASKRRSHIVTIMSAVGA